MQQTENLKLNLIETGDPISPAPINENAQKLEEALGGLDARIQVLELKKVAVGTYIGNGSTQTIELGFTPMAVIIYNANYGNGYGGIAVAGIPLYMFSQDHPMAAVTDGGFTLYVPYDKYHVNGTDKEYNYIAFG